MEDDMICPAEINSIAYLNKKRKPQAELLDSPLPKHVCWGQKIEYASSLPESINNSYSFPDDADSSMSSCDETKASVGPSASTTCWDDATSQIGLHSVEENRSTTKASSKKSEATSISDYGMLLYENCEGQLLEYGDCGFSEDQFNGVEKCADTDLEDLLYSNGVDASNYVLSSGRWPVGQDSQEKTKKLTIDKEFEEYFSMLML